MSQAGVDSECPCVLLQGEGGDFHSLSHFWLPVRQIIESFSVATNEQSVRVLLLVSSSLSSVELLVESRTVGWLGLIVSSH